MPDSVDDDEIRVRSPDQATNGRVIGASADLRKCRQEIDQLLDALLDAPSALRRMRRDIIENLVQIGEGPP
jgi:hypothetical protein